MIDKETEVPSVNNSMISGLIFNYLPKFASFLLGGTLMINNSIELHSFHRSCLKYYWIIDLH